MAMSCLPFLFCLVTSTLARLYLAHAVSSCCAWTLSSWVQVVVNVTQLCTNEPLTGSVAIAVIGALLLHVIDDTPSPPFPRPSPSC